MNKSTAAMIFGAVLAALFSVSAYAADGHDRGWRRHPQHERSGQHYARDQHDHRGHGWGGYERRRHDGWRSYRRSPKVRHYLYSRRDYRPRWYGRSRYDWGHRNRDYGKRHFGHDRRHPIAYGYRNGYRW